MKKSQKFIALSICLFAVISISSFSLMILTGNVSDSGKIKTLKMGLIPADDAAEMLRAYEPVQEYLSKELNLSILTKPILCIKPT